MDISSLNPAILRQLLTLSEQKAEHLEAIEKIDRQIAAISSGRPAPAPQSTGGARRGRKPASPSASAEPRAPKATRTPRATRGRGGKRGALKERILSLLEPAGPSGLAVKEISDRLGVKNQNVHVWFSTTGKKMAEIEKVGEARYAFVRSK